MELDKIKTAAIDAGLRFEPGEFSSVTGDTPGRLIDFARRVEAIAREECAIVCDQQAQQYLADNRPLARSGAHGCGVAIRRLLTRYRDAL